MEHMDRRQVLKGAVGLGVAGVLYSPQAALAHGRKGARYRWDIVNLGFPGPLCAREGGRASSKAQDGARITITGSGTFRDGRECSRKVTGGGTWTITPGTPPTPAAGSGTFKVAHFVSFELAPGTVPVADCIGDAADARAGRLTVTIRFSDGSEGVLEIGCRLAGSPDEIMEGITATKGFATFWNHEEPAAGVDGNRTLFHVLRKHDDDDDDDDD
ncbi:MAG: hypothetical protein ACRDPC_19225 [Solirubrobacteraceae bacterium]